MKDELGARSFLWNTMPEAWLCPKNHVMLFPTDCEKWATHNPDASMEAHVFVSVSTFILSVGVAHACLKLYDLPVRNWLKNRFLVNK